MKMEKEDIFLHEFKPKSQPEGKGYPATKT